VTGRAASLGAFVHALVALVIILAASILAGLHDLDGQTVAALFGTAVGLLGGSASSLGTLYTAVNGKSVVSAEALASRETTLRETVDRLAGARAQLPVDAPVQPPPPPPVGP
jgi:uncharacterized membrane protein